jgi:hypothetical protein
MLSDLVETLGESTLVCLLLGDWLKKLFCSTVQYRANKFIAEEDGPLVVLSAKNCIM